MTSPRETSPSSGRLLRKVASNGGQVFPKMRIDKVPRLQRFDVNHDMPDAFRHEFAPVADGAATDRGNRSRARIMAWREHRQPIPRRALPKPCRRADRQRFTARYPGLRIEAQRQVVAPLEQARCVVTPGLEALCFCTISSGLWFGR